MHEQETRDPNLGQTFREYLKLTLKFSNNKDAIVCLPEEKIIFKVEKSTHMFNFVLVKNIFNKIKPLTEIYKETGKKIHL